MKVSVNDIKIYTVKKINVLPVLTHLKLAFRFWDSIY